MVDNLPKKDRTENGSGRYVKRESHRGSVGRDVRLTTDAIEETSGERACLYAKDTRPRQ